MHLEIKINANKFEMCIITNSARLNTRGGGISGDSNRQWGWGGVGAGESGENIGFLGGGSLSKNFRINVAINFRGGKFRDSAGFLYVVVAGIYF